MADMFYVDVLDGKGYSFYVNMNKAITKGINEAVAKNIGDKNTQLILDKAKDYNGYDYANMFIFNPDTGQIDEQEMHFKMQGITASVNRSIAEEVLELAKFYCPKDTGYLESSGRIEENSDGSCKIFFDCPYAWYVHEFSWRKHNFPTCDHFLTRAIYEVQKAHGFGWA
jgi:hypothetical protein